MARAEPALRPSRNCWRIERAERATVVIDADDYFRRARQAMLSAEHQLVMVGWDFDGRIRLAYDEEDEAPTTVGSFVSWLVHRTAGLQVHVLRWDTGALKTLFRGTTAVTLVRWLRHPRIHLRLDGHHPTGASHHQKVVVIDDCLAFCGGIDMTDDRWDTRAHADEEPHRVEPNGRPYGPWHDATTALAGPVARALGELCRERWRRAGGERLPAPPASDACWPDDLDVGFRDCEVAISRTMPDMPDTPAVHEIEQLYLDLIARAERWIYAESQYFASHRIARAIADRLEEEDGPEIVIVNPVSAQGWLEPIAMDTARARLVEAIRRRDRHDRFRIYHAFTRGGQPIYIHAKVTVIDGEILRVGSSNFNNRSLRLDSECDVTIDATRPANAHAAGEVRGVAFNLLAEHLDTDAAMVEARLEETGSLIATIEAMARPSMRHLRPYHTPDLNAVKEWLADNEVLDPENPDELFEAMSGRPLLRGLAPIGTRSAVPLALGAAAALAAGIGALTLVSRRRRG